MYGRQWPCSFGFLPRSHSISKATKFSKTFGPKCHKLFWSCWGSFPTLERKAKMHGCWRPWLFGSPHSLIFNSTIHQYWYQTYLDQKCHKPMPTILKVSPTLGKNAKIYHQQRQWLFGSPSNLIFNLTIHKDPNFLGPKWHKPSFAMLRPLPSLGRKAKMYGRWWLWLFGPLPTSY